MMNYLALGALLLHVAFALQAPLRSESNMSVIEEPTQHVELVNTKAAAVGHHFSESIMEVSKQSISSMIVLVTAGFLMFLAWRSGLFGKEVKSQTTAGRSFLLDNAKVVAQFLVIYGHLTSYDVAPSANGQTIVDPHASRFALPSDAHQLLNVFRAAANTITVPMLCFISGVLSQGSCSEGRIRRFIHCLVIPTLIWIYVIKPVVLDTMMDPSVQGLGSRLQALFTLQSFHEEWYLQALIIWRSAVFLIFSHLQPSAALASMLALSCIGGHVQFTGPLSYFKFEEACGYLPYFGIGYVFPFEAARIRTERSSVPVALTGVLAFIWMIFVVPRIGILPDYHSSSMDLTFKEGNLVDHAHYVARHLARVALEMPVVFAILFYLMPRSKTCFTWIGPHVLYPYLFHGLAIHWGNQMAICFMHSQPTFVNSPMAYTVIQLLNCLYAVMVLVLLASRPWRMCFSWGLEPSWLGCFFEALPNPEHTKQAPGSATWRQSVAPLSCISARFHQPSQTPRLVDVSACMASSSSSTDLPRVQNGRGPSSAISGDVIASSDVPLLSEADARSVTSLKSVMSVPELLPYRPFSREQQWQSTGTVLPRQAACHKYYPWLLSLFVGTVIFCSIGIVVVVLYVPGYRLAGVTYSQMPLALIMSLYLFAMASPVVFYAYHYWRLSRAVDLPEKPSASPLMHAIVVCTYMEPVDVLRRTMDSIMGQCGLSTRPIVVFAAEAHDPTAQSCFSYLSEHFGSAFEFLMTKHELKAGEIIGKSSNANWAVQELYRLLIKDQAHDPFEVMVTIVDADSVLSSTYLAQTESAFRNQRDGRRLIYTGPLNVYRNFADANMFVQCFEMSRCHMDLFHDPTQFIMPAYNYSLTLGLCHEIDYWTADSMADDLHTCTKVKVNSFGGWSCVATTAIICNDLVTGFGDRYKQAKNLQLGAMTQFAWVASLYFESELSFQAWIIVLKAEFARPGSFMDVALKVVFMMCKILVLCFLYCHPALLHNPYVVVALGWRFVLFWIAEFLTWRYLMPQFRLKVPSPTRWFALVVLSPVMQTACDLIFLILPTFDVLVHLALEGELAYVHAPKGEDQEPETCTNTTIPDASGGTAAPILASQGGEPATCPAVEAGALAPGLLDRLSE